MVDGNLQSQVYGLFDVKDNGSIVKPLLIHPNREFDIRPYRTTVGFFRSAPVAGSLVVGQVAGLDGSLVRHILARTASAMAANAPAPRSPDKGYLLVPHELRSVS
jgi:hypothetical protein